MNNYAYGGDLNHDVVLNNDFDAAHGIVLEKMEYVQGDTEDIAEMLIHNMNEHNGVGITASQLGYNMSAFAFKEYDGTKFTDKVAFNPEILSYSPDQILAEEGCLSYPGLIVKVKRPATVRVSYMDSHGETVDTVLGEFTARVFCHEYDHTQGIDFRDRASRLHLQMARKKRKVNLRRMKRFYQSQQRQAETA